MKTFDDLEFTEHSISKTAKEVIEQQPELEHLLKNQLNHKQATITFDNGINLSVIFGEMFYSNGVDTYECMILGSGSPVGNLSKEQVTDYMEQLQQEKGN